MENNAQEDSAKENLIPATAAKPDTTAAVPIRARKSHVVPSPRTTSPVSRASPLPLREAPEFQARRQGLLDKLRKTPPRPSYADKVKGIFSTPQQRKHSGLSRGLSAGAAGITRERSSASGSDSPLTSESEVKPHNLDRSPSNSPLKRLREGPRRAPVAAAPVVDFQRTPESHMRSPWVEQNSPLQQQDSHTNPRDRRLAVQQAVEQLNIAAEAPSSSSDEWTGDEDFYPRAKKFRSQSLAVAGTSSCWRQTRCEGAVIPAASAIPRPAIGRLEPVRAPRSSRFRGVFLDRLHEKSSSSSSAASSRRNNRSSDADDEAESDDLE